MAQPKPRQPRVKKQPPLVKPLPVKTLRVQKKPSSPKKMMVQSDVGMVPPQ